MPIIEKLHSAVDLKAKGTSECKWAYSTSTSLQLLKPNMFFHGNTQQLQRKARQSLCIYFRDAEKQGSKMQWYKIITCTRCHQANITSTYLHLHVLNTCIYLQCCVMMSEWASHHLPPNHRWVGRCYLKNSFVAFEYDALYNWWNKYNVQHNNVLG